MNRGEDFEASIPRDEYFDAGYFEVRQLLAQAMQISMLKNLGPANLLEIGIGNGFTSTFLRLSGMKVVTVDINKDLNPDVCISISDVLSHFGEDAFDLIACCEVLEHLPFSEFSKNILSLRKTAKRLFLTLPSYSRSYGISGILKLPAMKARCFNLCLHPRKRSSLDNTEHFWEVGYRNDCTKKKIVEILKSSYENVQCGRMPMKPNQLFFIAE